MGIEEDSFFDVMCTNIHILFTFIAIIGIVMGDITNNSCLGYSILLAGLSFLWGYRAK